MGAAAAPPTTRRGLALGLGAIGLAAPGGARGAAAGFPERPIRLINPWGAGSSSDVQMRSLADVAQRHFGQPVLVENRPGASGTLHMVPLAREIRPDGYTLGQMHLSAIRRPFLVRAPQWDLAADYTYVIGLCGWVTGVAVRADAPWRSWGELVAAARAEPGRIAPALWLLLGLVPALLAVIDLAGRLGEGLGVFEDLLLMFSGDQLGDSLALLVCLMAGAALAIVAAAGRGPAPASPEMTIEARPGQGEPIVYRRPRPEEAEQAEPEGGSAEGEPPETEPGQPETEPEPERDPRLWSKPVGSSSPPPGRRRLAPCPSVA
jgi:hypothetical protein